MRSISLTLITLALYSSHWSNNLEFISDRKDTVSFIVSRIFISWPMSVGITVTFMSAQYSLESVVLMLAKPCLWKFIFLEVEVGSISTKADFVEDIGLLVMSAIAVSRTGFTTGKDVSFTPRIVRLTDTAKISVMSKRKRIMFVQKMATYKFSLISLYILFYYIRMLPVVLVPVVI